MGNVYALARPKDTWSIGYASQVQIWKDSIYVVVVASNQPGVTNENKAKWFVIYGPEGSAEIEEEDADHCMGLLLDNAELDFLPNSETDALHKAIEARDEHDQIRIDLDMAFNGIQKIVSTMRSLAGQTHETDHTLHSQLCGYVDRLGKILEDYHGQS